jgi:hypothetical protein
MYRVVRQLWIIRKPLAAVAFSSSFPDFFIDAGTRCVWFPEVSSRFPDNPSLTDHTVIPEIKPSVLGPRIEDLVSPYISFSESTDTLLYYLDNLLHPFQFIDM